MLLPLFLYLYAMKRILIFILLLSSTILLRAQTTQDSTLMLYRGYVGGMMVHLGYGSGGILTPTGSSQAIEVKGVSSGIGGKIAVLLGDHFRAGAEGYVSTIKYGDNRKASLGWGGLSGDYGWIWDKWRLYFGVTLGAGGYENMASLDSTLNNNTPQETVWNSYSIFIIDPYIEINFSLTKKILLCAKVDWITSPSANNSSFKDYSTGPRLYLGFMFTK